MGARLRALLDPAPLLVVPLVNQGLEPPIEPRGVKNLIQPKLHEVEIIREEDRFLRASLNLKVVVVAFLVPGVVGEQLGVLDIVELQDVVRGDRELVRPVVGHEDTFYWVDVDVSLVRAQLKAMHLHERALNSLKRKQSRVWRLQRFQV